MIKLPRLGELVIIALISATLYYLSVEGAFLPTNRLNAGEYVLYLVIADIFLCFINYQLRTHYDVELMGQSKSKRSTFTKLEITPIRNYLLLLWDNRKDLLEYVLTILLIATEWMISGFDPRFTNVLRFMSVPLIFNCQWFYRAIPSVV